VWRFVAKASPNDRGAALCYTFRVSRVDDTTYAVPHSNAFKPAAAWHSLSYLYFVFALYERKNEIQKKIKYRSAEGWIADCVTRLDEKYNG
jgi:hypothetical protein